MMECVRARRTDGMFSDTAVRGERMLPDLPLRVWLGTQFLDRQLNNLRPAGTERTGDPPLSNRDRHAESGPVSAQLDDVVSARRASRVADAVHLV
jgi:hypothetical protein